MNKQTLTKLSILSMLDFGFGHSLRGYVLFEDSFSSGSLSNWNITSQNSSTASIEGEDLRLSYGNGTWGSGVTMDTTSSFDISQGKYVEFTIQKVDYVEALYDNDPAHYREFGFGLGSLAYFRYGHSNSQEYLRFYVNGTKVYDSGIWPADTLVEDGRYLGFRLYEDGWEMIGPSEDGVTYSVWRQGAATINRSVPQFVNIKIVNANDYGVKMDLDNVSLSYVPEPATLSLLLMAGLALVCRRKS